METKTNFQLREYAILFSIALLLLFVIPIAKASGTDIGGLGGDAGIPINLTVNSNANVTNTDNNSSTHQNNDNSNREDNDDSLLIPISSPNSNSTNSSINNSASNSTTYAFNNSSLNFHKFNFSKPDISPLVVLLSITSILEFIVLLMLLYLSGAKKSFADESVSAENSEVIAEKPAKKTRAKKLIAKESEVKDIKKGIEE